MLAMYVRLQLASQRQGKLLFIYNFDMQPRIFYLFEKNRGAENIIRGIG